MTLAPLVDNPTVYLDSDFGPVTVRLTAPDAQALADIEANAGDATTDVVFTADDYGGGSGRGAIALRGSTSRGAIQKSFQIRLANDAAPWRGGRVINLLKHPFDLTRVRNTLSFESFRAISSFVSFRTGFVHLFVDGADRGLYEWIEEPDEAFLAAHGLDPRGVLYRPKLFTFAPTPEDGNDLPKLRSMLAAVNDPAQPIDDVIARHFDRDNYITWLAVNVLTADFDSESQNFILYSPSDRDGWYFVPWDYDGAWGWNEQPLSPPRPRWRQGLAGWWSVVLHQRFLSVAANLADLDARIRELAATTFSDGSVAAKLARYHDLVASFISVEPDINNLPCDTAGTKAAIAAWEAEYTRIASNARRAYAEYLATLDRPMPFWLYEPVVDASGVILSWSPSFQLRGRALNYDVDVNAAETFDPGSLIVARSNLAEPRFAAGPLPRGRHFWRVVARSVTDPANDWQLAFNDHLPLEVA